jgi:hypothetical protein
LSGPHGSLNFFGGEIYLSVRATEADIARR